MADAVEVYTPYSTARPFMGTLPTWMTEQDAERVLSYQIYEQIYWNVPGTFRLVARGSENNPIYIPSGKAIIDTTDRYTAAGFGYIADPQFGTPNDQNTAAVAFKALFDRERFLSKFHSNKLFGVIRGDWLWHVVADPNALPGRRISIYALDPGSVFKVTHPEDDDIVLGVHIIEEYKDGDKTLIKRQTYSKGPDPYDPSKIDGKIWSSLAVYSMDDWNKPGGKVTARITDPFPLPDTIQAFPVYHIRNIEEPGNLWGSSEIRGMERIVAAINQAISDEELALALEGLGMYATNSGPPTDADGNEVPWRLGPGRVVEVEGDGNGADSGTWFKRVNGVGSVTPVMDHLRFLIGSLRDGTATPAVASGDVEVSVAESGIALALRMSPLLAKVEVKDISIRDEHVRMFYDLKAWLQEYEGINTGEALIIPQFGDKLPVDRDGEVKRILAMVDASVMAPATARVALTRLGYVFADNEGELIAQAASAAASASDPFAARLTQEGA